jgi:hypothetical protein
VAKEKVKGKEITEEDLQKYLDIKERGFEAYESKILKEKEGGEIPSKKRVRNAIILTYSVLLLSSLLFTFFKIETFSLFFVTMFLPFTAMFMLGILLWWGGRRYADATIVLMAITISIPTVIYSYLQGFKNWFNFFNEQITIVIVNWVWIFFLAILGAIVGGVVNQYSSRMPINFKDWRKSFLKIDDEIGVHIDVIEDVLENISDFYSLERISSDDSNGVFKAVYSNDYHKIILISKKESLGFLWFEKMGRYFIQDKECLRLNNKMKFALKNILGFKEIEDSSVIQELNTEIDSSLNGIVEARDLFKGSYREHKDKIITGAVIIILTVFIIGISLLIPGVSTLKTTLTSVLSAVLGLTVFWGVIKKYILKEE